MFDSAFCLVIQYGMNQIAESFYSFAGSKSALFFISACLLLAVFFVLGRTVGKLEEQKSNRKFLKSQRSDAVKRSRAVIHGQISEQFAPLFPDFPARYDEVNFLGKPVDFIGFCGLDAETGENEKCRVDEILFIEVKTGDSKLSEREKAVKDAVENGRVRYVVWRKK